MNFSERLAKTGRYLERKRGDVISLMLGAGAGPFLFNRDSILKNALEGLAVGLSAVTVSSIASLAKKGESVFRGRSTFGTHADRDLLDYTDRKFQNLIAPYVSGRGAAIPPAVAQKAKGYISDAFKAAGRTQIECRDGETTPVFAFKYLRDAFPGENPGIKEIVFATLPANPVPYARPMK